MTYTGKLVYNDTSHSYWLDGKRVKSASKVAQIAADSFTIEQWRGRQHVIGMTLDPTLRERAAVDLDNREAIQQIADDALSAAKSNARAQRGTQRHRVFELGLLGRQDQFITDQQIADWKVLERTLDAYGLEPMLDRVEQFVAWPDNGVVGRYDCYLKYRGIPSLVDLKGGENAVKYPHSTAVQCWLYRFAPHTSARVIKAGDKSEVTEWTTVPDDADPEHAYVLYCDDHHDVGELWQLDLSGAQRGAQLALGIVDWRKTKNYGKELAQPIKLEDEELEWERHQEDDDEPMSPVPENTIVPPDIIHDTAYNTRRKRLLERYRAMSDSEKMAYCDLHIDGNNLDAVEQALNKVDRFNIELEPIKPTLTVVPDLPAPPDEGDTVDTADVDALKKRFDKLPLEASLWTGRLVAEGKQSYDFRIKDRPTVRRYELYRGILALAEWARDEADDIIIKAIISQVRSESNLADAPGRLLGQLDAEQAKHFADLAYEFTQDRLALITDEGTETLRIVAATTK